MHQNAPPPPEPAQPSDALGRRAASATGKPSRPWDPIRAPLPLHIPVLDSTPTSGHPAGDVPRPEGLGGFRGARLCRPGCSPCPPPRVRALRRFPAAGSRPKSTSTTSSTGSPPARRPRRTTTRARPARRPRRRAADAAPRQRSVWILKEIEDFTYAQIATVMAATPDAVRGYSNGPHPLAITMKEWRCHRPQRRRRTRPGRPATAPAHRRRLDRDQRRHPAPRPTRVPALSPRPRPPSAR